MAYKIRLEGSLTHRPSRSSLVLVSYYRIHQNILTDDRAARTMAHPAEEQVCHGGGGLRLDASYSEFGDAMGLPMHQGK
jgi:hypothetical protein